MIAVRLMGGVGNQMFQYAFGRYVAIAKNCSLWLDTKGGFIGDPYGRKYCLDYFKIETMRGTEVQIPAFVNFRTPWRQISRLARRVRGEAEWRVVTEENEFRYDERACSAETPAYYSGYWQCRDYVEPIKETIRREFTPRLTTSKALTDILTELRERDAISVHVRCLHGVSQAGDRLKGREIHGVMGPRYYADAVDAVRGRSNHGRVLVFTDDFEWCKKHLELGVAWSWIGELYRGSDMEEMILMSACRHHVVANSTFSWWGAWLGTREGTRVAAPKRWFAEPNRGVGELFPKTWMVI